jgi:hypothetical protein
MQSADAHQLGMYTTVTCSSTGAAPYGDASRLELPWRPIYDSLLQCAFRGSSWEGATVGEAEQIIGSEAAKFHKTALLGLARRARNFFHRGASEEILSELRPYFCPHDERCLLRATALLSWFLPDEVRDPGALVAELVGVWELMPSGNEWNKLWFGMLSRLVRHNPDETIPSLQPLLPRLFAAILRFLAVPTAKVVPSNVPCNDVTLFILLAHTCMYLFVKDPHAKS